MQIILITQSGHRMLSMRLSGWRLWTVVGLLSALLATAAISFTAHMASEGTLADRLASWWELSRDDAVARELGGLEAKLKQLESTVSAMEDERVANSPAGEVDVPSEAAPPRMEDLELRFKKISLAVDGVAATRQKMLDSMASGVAARPIEAGVSSGFGYRRDPINKSRRFHRGIDFQADAGTPVHSVGDGVVEFIGDAPKYGKVVDIRHSPRLVSRYAHLEGIEVTSGMPLRAGQRIARVGSTGRSTGAHLHFEFILDDHPINPGSLLVHLYDSQRLTDNTPLPPKKYL